MKSPRIIPGMMAGGGERGIRTLDGTFAPYSLSRRAPSASSAISPKNFSKIFYIKLRSNFIGGGSRIRTHGGVTLNGFQDRRFRPLSHPSIFAINYTFTIPVGYGQYLSIFWSVIVYELPCTLRRAARVGFVCIMC